MFLFAPEGVGDSSLLIFYNFNNGSRIKILGHISGKSTLMHLIGHEHPKFWNAPDRL